MPFLSRKHSAVQATCSGTQGRKLRERMQHCTSGFGASVQTRACLFHGIDVQNFEREWDPVSDLQIHDRARRLTRDERCVMSFAFDNHSERNERIHFFCLNECGTDERNFEGAGCCIRAHITLCNPRIPKNLLGSFHQF